LRDSFAADPRQGVVTVPLRDFEVTVVDVRQRTSHFGGDRETFRRSSE
jgi:hypothetical protein